MIATLTGVITEKIGDIVVLDVAGVGYGLLMNTEDLAGLPAGEPLKLYIYEHIREQSHDLFGFVSLDSKQLFELLLSVNGVGPKMALGVLNIGTGDEVRTAIASGDVKFVQQAAGVGKRVADRIVVDLIDKVGVEGADLPSTGLLQGEAIVLHDEAAEALVALGYTPQDAAQALYAVDTSLPTEERVKLALKTPVR